MSHQVDGFASENSRTPPNMGWIELPQNPLVNIISFPMKKRRRPSHPAVKWQGRGGRAAFLGQSWELINGIFTYWGINLLGY